MFRSLKKIAPTWSLCPAAFLVLMLMLCPASDVGAQVLVDFESHPIDPTDPWVACSVIFDQYSGPGLPGITFYNVDANGNFHSNPALAHVGGEADYSAGHCGYEGFPVGPYVNRSQGGIGAGPHVVHPFPCAQPGCSVLDSLGDFDIPVYDENAVPPATTGTPPDALHDVGCYFLTAACGGIPAGTGAGIWNALKVEYDDDLFCTELSGVILDTDVRDNRPLPTVANNACGWEIWQIEAYYDAGTPGNIFDDVKLKEVRIYPFDDPNGDEYWHPAFPGDSTSDPTSDYSYWPDDGSGNANCTPNNEASAYDTDDNDIPDTPVSSYINVGDVDGDQIDDTGHLRGDGSPRRFDIRLDDPVPTVTNRISYVLIREIGVFPGGSVGLGFDLFSPCSASGSCEAVNEIIECGSDVPGDDYTVTFDVVNNTQFDVTQLVIPGLVGGSTITPNVINLTLDAGDTATGIQLSIAGGQPGDTLCIPVGLIAPDPDGSGGQFECCSTEVCVELPNCCLSISDVQLVNNADGSISFSFAVTNEGGPDAPVTAEHLFMSVVSPAGISISNQWHALNGLGVGNSIALSTDIFGGPLPGAPDIEVCFQLTMHNAQLESCCGKEYCITLTDGTGSPISDPIPQFLRGDANSDGAFDISDVVSGLDYLFQAQAVPCLVALDSNDDETVDIADSIYSLDALFGGGPSPWPPYQQCGVDETTGPLGCEYFPACEDDGSGPLGG